MLEPLLVNPLFGAESNSLKMPRSESDSDDVFFDAFEDVRSAGEPSCSEDCSTSDEVSGPMKLEYEIWANEPISVQERRQRFLKGMGFDDFVSTRTDSFQCDGEITAVESSSDMEERIVSGHSSVDSSVCDNESDFDGCIRDMDSGKRYIVHNGARSSITDMPKEVGSDKVMSLLEFESLLGLSSSVQKLLRRGCGNSPAKETKSAKKRDGKSLWRKFVTERSFGGICKYDVHVKNCTNNIPTRTRVHHRKKSFLEFSAVYMDQGIRAHTSSIRVMKFSPSGWYLASGGEDCAVRIWQIIEVEASPKLYKGEDPYEKEEKVQVFKTNIGKGPQNHALAVIPKTVFRISEAPLHEFRGHTSDILDMAWSKSDYLLTSSKDKTVRLWKPGCDGCLAVFKHKDYVTCVQFNPIDEKYFISGSLDGKVRIWDVLDKRVTDWVDTRTIITALSYQPDGKGFVVGTVAGACRFYDQSGENIQLEKELFVQGKKSAASRINSLKLCTSDSNRVIVTSGDSKIRVANGDTIQKFEGPWKSKALSSPSLTSDGRYLISAGKDSNVYIWNFAYSRDARSVRSCELFFSKDVTAAVPWPGVYRDGHTKPSCLTEKSSSMPILRHHGECQSPEPWSFVDGSKGSATWPEEKLPSAAKPESSPQLGDCLSMISAAWSTVIVTASRDGVIRSFPNYGLPVRL